MLWEKKWTYDELLADVESVIDQIVEEDWNVGKTGGI